MRKIYALIIVSLVLFMGCTPRVQVFEDFSDANIIWNDYEKSSYDVLVDGQKIAQYETIIEKDIQNDQDVYMVETTINSKDGVSIQSALVNTYLEPISSENKQILRGETISGSAEVYGYYKDGELKIDKIIADSYNTNSLKVPENIIDNEYSLMVPRNLPLSVGYSRKLNIGVIVTSQIAPYSISVEGIEQVKVPFGEVECYKVVWKYLGRQRVPNVYSWYSTGNDRKMVKYINENFELRLTEFNTSKS